MVTRPRRGLAMGLWLLLLLALGGCGTLPPIDRTAPASEAIALSTATTLGRIADSYRPAPDQSGFRLMPLGSYSLDTRVQLAQRAQVSLDVQYYHLGNDDSGRQLLRALRDAALRGVRVRLLLDDFYTSGQDEMLLGLAAFPNVEVRLFNPFCCLRDRGQVSRFLASVGDIKRLNHRMHNKLYIADGAMAVVGGRNVANEYFLRNAQGLNFIDVDAFVVGWVVAPLQSQFDRYWNADAVYPIQALASSTLTPIELRERFNARSTPAGTPATSTALPTSDVLGYGPISEDLDAGRLGLIWGTAYAFADHPDKPFDSEPGAEPADTSVLYNLAQVIRQAKKEVVLSSPYLVPGERGMALMAELRARDVRVTAMTNSLGATDEPLVHVGYSAYRGPMLDLGVDLYELSGSRVKRNRRENLFGASLGRLHAKLAVIDRRWLFVGSMNLDPRSESINTELGMVIDSPPLAREMLHVIDIDRLQSAYRLRKTADGGCCEWLGYEDDTELLLTEEPDSSLWQRFKLLLLGPFVPEWLL